MHDVLSYRVHGVVAVLGMNNPPVNGLSHELRCALAEGFLAASKDPLVKALLLIGSDKVFCAGADIRELDTDKALRTPSLPELNTLQDDLNKPLVAAIGGFALGGGLELAMGCHYRIARSDARLGLPEIKLGILPASGGTQRLSRLVPITKSIEMMLSGNPTTAVTAKELGLVDEIIDGNLLESALAYVNGLILNGKSVRRVRDMKAKVNGDADALFSQVRLSVGRESRGFPAPLEIVACVEAATTKSFDEGLQEEIRRYQYLVGTRESKALRYAFFAERQTTKIPDIPGNTATREIRRAAVIGAGTMGVGIAIAFLNSGLPVMLIEERQEAIDRGVAIIQKTYSRKVAQGHMNKAEAAHCLAGLTVSNSMAAIRNVDIVVEAVYEQMDVKQAVFRQIAAIAKPGAILATNTSTLNVDQIASATQRPEDVIGMHFFSPANVMRLLEVVRAEKTSREVLATIIKLGKALGKLPVVSGVCDGFIGNRMLDRYAYQALQLLEEGATPHQIDGALEDWGFAMGLFTMWDLAGNDVVYEIQKRCRREKPAMAYSNFIDQIAESGRYGQKVGKGWHRYKQSERKPEADPEVEDMLDSYRKKIGVKPRTIQNTEIVERCVLAMVNEGARILQEGIAHRGSDIDMVFLAGFGFPRYRGGPMYYADAIGLDKVIAAISRFQQGYKGSQWLVAPLLARFAQEGKRFTN